MLINTRWLVIVSGLNGLSYNNTAVVQQGLMLMLMLMWLAIAEIGTTAGWRSACNQHKSRNAHLCIFVGMSCLFSRENTPHTQQSFVLYAAENTPATGVLPRRLLAARGTYMYINTPEEPDNPRKCAEKKRRVFVRPRTQPPTHENYAGCTICYASLHTCT